MAIFFLDSSVLVKLYVAEPGTAGILRLAATPGARLGVSALGALEFQVALRVRVRRGELTPDQADGMLAHFASRASRSLFRQPLTDAVFSLAATLVDRHPLRAPDALQLAACVAVHQTQPSADLYFVCSDKPLLRAAAAERIPSWDPAAAETPAP
ncbi:MAG: type II toxin-antitoxin system VapC family toxin [Terriglobales bacterium]